MAHESRFFYADDTDHDVRSAPQIERQIIDVGLFSDLQEKLMIDFGVGRIDADGMTVDVNDDPTHSLDIDPHFGVPPAALVTMVFWMITGEGDFVGMVDGDAAEDKPHCCSDRVDFRHPPESKK